MERLSLNGHITCGLCPSNVNTALVIYAEPDDVPTDIVLIEDDSKDLSLEDIAHYEESPFSESVV